MHGDTNGSILCGGGYMRVVPQVKVGRFSNQQPELLPV